MREDTILGNTVHTFEKCPLSFLPGFPFFRVNRSSNSTGLSQDMFCPWKTSDCLLNWVVLSLNSGGNMGSCVASYGLKSLSDSEFSRGEYLPLFINFCYGMIFMDSKLSGTVFQNSKLSGFFINGTESMKTFPEQ